MSSFSQIELVKKAAEAGDIDAQKFMGDSYLNGKNGVNKNVRSAYQWYLEAAKQGDAEAQYTVYELLAFDKSSLFSDDETKSCGEYLKKSADQGYASALAEWGRVQLHLVKDFDQAFRYFTMAVDRGSLKACFWLGYCYLEGIGTERNTQKAEECFQKSIEGGNHHFGYWGMAHCAQANKNYEKAIEYFQKSIDAGNPQACNDMAYLYAQGKGTRKDLKEAHRLIDIAMTDYPDYLDYLDTKGEFYLMENKIAEANEIWNKIKSKDADFAKNHNSNFCQAMRSQMGDNVDINIAVTDVVNQNTYAVIIANENYKYEAKVPFAANDGNIFRTYCTKTLGIPEEHIKSISDATYNDIRYALSWLRQITSTANGQAKIIFYYAGHGIPDESQKNAYLLPVDGYGADVATGYSLENLYTALGEMPSQSVVAFLDACFSGSKREGDMLASARGVAIKVTPNTPKGQLLVFSAAQGDETAYPYTEQGHGMFTYYLLKKLQETKGEVALDVLSNYVIDQVRKQSIVVNGKLQTPAINASETLGNSWKSWKLK